MMADAAKEARRSRDWRTIVFRILAALATLFFVTNLRLIPEPWLAQGAPDFRQWSDAMTVAIAMLIVGSLVAVIWRPRAMPLPLQYLAIATVLAVVVVAPFEGPYIFFVVIPLVLVIAAYPEPRALMSLTPEGSISRPLLALGLLAMVLLAPGLWLALSRELQGMSGDWISNFEHTVSLLLAGILTSTKRPGWQVLGILTGATFLYLGAAALAVPDAPGSWGLTGGILALLCGAGYIALTFFEARRIARVAAVSQEVR
ncbi:hypothetical protein BH18ACT11_BH18ACT11_16020 [soil metagenome]